MLAMGISFGIGFILQSFVSEYKAKVFLFILFPMATFLLLLPLPKGSTPLKVFSISTSTEKL